MSAFERKTTRRQHRAIAALLACPTIAEAAAKCGVAESTIRRWFHSQVFTFEYRAARTRMLEASINHLRNEAAGAVSVLTSIAKDEKCSPAARVSAARSILDLSIRTAELMDLEERLAALEQKGDQ